MMSFVRILRDRIRALWRPDDVQDEIGDELRFHMEMRAGENLRRGMTPSEARAQARNTFGRLGFIQDLAYDVRGGGWIESALQDLRYAVRGLRAKPVFTAGVVLTLALGIGANAAMFGIVDRLLLRPPAFLRDPERVHRVYQYWTNNGRTEPRVVTRFPRYIDLQELTHSFASIVAFSNGNLPVGDGADSREQRITSASGNFFSQFAAQPVLGRFFTPDDDRVPTGSPVAVLGYTYWQTAYAGRPDVIGRQVRIGRTLCTIIGIAPEGFRGLSETGDPAMYIPLTTAAWNARGRDLRPDYDYTKAYSWGWIQLFARRKDGVSVEAANTDLTRALALSFQRESQKIELDKLRPYVELGPVQTSRGPLAGPEAKVAAWVSGVALVVLLIACANVANLLIARAASRRREIALRLALGVSRVRLLRQLFSESLVLSALGGAVGLAGAQWGIRVLRALFLPADVATAVVSDRRTLLVSFVVVLGVALLTSLAPFAQAFRYRRSLAIHAGGRDVPGSSSRLRTGLLLLQAALCVVLLTGAGLFVRSFANVRGARLGFDVDPLMVVIEAYRDVRLKRADAIDLERRLVDAARTIPGVVAATQSPSVPYMGFEGRALFVPGIDSVESRGNFELQTGNGDFFRTYGTKILRGRAFSDADGAESARVVVVGERMANDLWPGADPLGKCVHIGGADAPCSSVIGVAEEMHIRSITEAGGTGVAGKKEFTYSIPISQYDGAAGTLIVRVAGDAAAFSEPVRRRLQQLMPGSSYVTTRPLRALLDPQMQSWRMGATMFGAFAALALVLAGVGLYSVIAYGVGQRRREIGVRIALGASRRSVVAMVMRGSVALVGVGAALGIAASLLGGKWIAPLLYQVSPRDPAVFAIVTATLAVVGLTATALPAHAAASVDPSVALRED